MRRICSAVLLASIAAAGCQRKARDGAAPAPEPAKGAPAAAQGSARGGPLVPDPLPGARTDVTAAVGKADRAAIGDLDGDGRNEIVVADAQRLRVLDAAGQERASVEVPGGIQVLRVVSPGGDRRGEIVAGWGQSREHREAPARVDLYRLDGARLLGEAIAAPQTTRNEIAAILPIAEERGALLVAYYESKYFVRIAIARRGPAWSLTDVATVRMGMAYARGDLDGDGRPDLVVGRPYGDEQDKEGDAFVLRDGGERVAIPTTRGVRELAIADADGDGKPELFLADGWNRDYGRIARGRLTWVRRVDGALRAELIEDTPGQFTVGRILPADVGGDGRVEIVTVGSAYVRVFDRRSGRWEGLTVAGAARDVAVGDLDGAPGDELLILGDKDEIVSLRELRRGGAR